MVPRDLIFALLSSVGSRASMLCLSVLGVRLLSIDDYGRFAYYLSIVASLGTVAAVGTGVTLNMYFARHGTSNREAARKLMFTSVTLTSVLSLLITVVTFWLLRGAHGTEGAELGLLLGALIWLIGLNGIAEGTLNGLSMYRRLAINSFTTLLFTALGAGAAMIAWGFWGGMLGMLGFRLSALVLNLRPLLDERLFTLRLPIHTLREREIISTFSGISLPAMLGGVMVGPVLAMAFRMASEHPDGFRGIAYFSWIQQLYLIAVFVPGALGGFFITRLSQSSDHAMAFKIMSRNALFAVAVTIPFFLLKPWLLGFGGFGNSEPAQLAFDLMAAAVILFSLNAAFASYWPASGQGWMGFAANFLWAALFLATVSLGVGRLGAVSLALAYVVAYSGQLLAQTALYSYLVRKASK